MLILFFFKQSEDTSIETSDSKELVTIESGNDVEASPESTNGKQGIPLADLPETGFNYVNSIIGSGVIGIPYALHRAGFVLGIFLLIVIAVLTDYSLVILVKAGNIAGVSTYQDVVEAAFGRSGFYLLTLIQFIYPFIAMISYNVIIGDTATKAFIRIFHGMSFTYTSVTKKRFLLHLLF
jgi:sodium-coupled neutral amino acid transporter 11